MAIPGIPQNFVAQTANLQNYLSWNISPGATSYSVQRSLDGVNYTALATPTLNNYADTTVASGVQYFYQVAATNISGTSPYTSPQSLIPAPTGELSLASLRYYSQTKADRVNSQFVSTQEWNYFINLAMNELYDLITSVYEDYFVAPFASFQVDGSTFQYPLPNGIQTFTNQAGQSFVAPPFYKLLGVDLALNTSANGFVTVNRFNLIDRNRFVYPNTASTIYGVFNLQYRVLGNSIEFIPTPSAGQIIRLIYVPRLPEMVRDTDVTTIGYSGWLNYVIVRAAKYALDKEESDTSVLVQELGFLKARIEEMANNRDAGQPDTISDVRKGDWGNGYGSGGPAGTVGGW